MGLVRLLVRLAMIVFTAGVALALMALALVTLAAMFVWSLLRGRKPTVDLSGLRRARKRMADGDVMDVEAREIREPQVPARRLTSSRNE